MSDATVLAAKNPADVVEYVPTFGSLAPDTINSVSVVGSGITVLGSPAPSYSGQSVTFWVSGGTAGAEPTVAVTITTAAGRTIRRTFVVPIKEL